MPLYAFEAKGIQSYIVEGGKLRDIAGASEIVHGLAKVEGNDLVGEVLATIEGGDAVTFSRRAGGAFTVYTPDPRPLRELRTLFTLAVARNAPGLAYVDALIETAGFIAALSLLPARLQAARARPAADMPCLSPAVMAAPRTGRPAVARDPRRGGEMVDAATSAKSDVFNALRGGHAKAVAEARFLPLALRGQVNFPVGFAEDGDVQTRVASAPVFPMLRDRSTIALVHADGNRLGATLIGMVDALKPQASDGIAPDDEAAAEFLFEFSQIIVQITEEAVQQAVGATIKGVGADRVMPMRPIVLGGDDLSLIVRGDLALGFVSEYLRAFHRGSKDTLRTFTERYDADGSAALRRAAGTVPAALSAGAGIAYVHKNHPFVAAHELAEALAKHAKTAAKEATGGVPPSLVSFHRVTTALGTDWLDIETHELEVSERGSPLRLTLAPYEVPADDAGVTRFPSVASLSDLVDCIERSEIPIGPIRQTIGSLRTAPSEARRIYERWCDVMKRTAPRRQAFEAFEKCLAALDADPSDLAIVPRSPTGTRATPLLDALTVRAARKGDSAMDEADG